jgi:hypothetical protein
MSILTLAMLSIALLWRPLENAMMAKQIHLEHERAQLDIAYSEVIVDEVAGTVSA